MTTEEFVRPAHAVAEAKDLAAWVACFNRQPATRMDAPCCDVFRLEDGRIPRCDCYPSGTMILGQLGVLGNLEAMPQQPATV